MIQARRLIFGGRALKPVVPADEEAPDTSSSSAQTRATSARGLLVIHIFGR